MPRMAGNRSSSIELSEVVINTGEAAWTQVDAQCTVDVSALIVKRGTNSASFAIAAAAAQGIQAYGASAAAALDLRAWPTAWGFTHIKYWGRANAVVTADQLRIGMSNAADNLGTEYYVAVPALAADTWTLVRTALSADMITNLSSVDSVHLYLQDTAYAGTVYLDDIRICRYDTFGDSAITIPETQTVGNTNLDKTHCELFYMPWRTRLVTVYELPVDLTLTGYMGTNPATWTSSDLLQGRKRLYSGQTAEEFEACWTSAAVRSEADLAAPAFTDSDTWTAEFLSLEVSE